MLIPILVALLVAVTLVSMIVVISGHKSKRKNGPISNSVQRKGKSAVVKEYEKKLSHDPHNIPALEALGDIYYQDKNWEKVWGVYKTLYDLAPAHVEIDVAKTTRRIGVAAFFQEKYDETIAYMMQSARKDSENFDTNFYLGKAFYQKGNYDKAIVCFKKCKLLAPESSDANEYLGFSYFKSSKYKESLPYLKKLLEETPDNKEVLYDMAVAMAETGYNDKALKIFVHLRPDPVFGPQSSLEAGKMHERQKNFTAAVQDYEIGMKLENVPEPIKVQILYRCANAYIGQNNIPKALTLLKQIQGIHSGYKDVDSLVSRYQELNQNKNLQVYLMSGTSDFVALCRKLITAYYTNCFVKVEDVAIATESVEIICYIETNKWEAKNIFRFYRTQTVIGDLYVREFHTKLKDSKCDNGFCVTMGSFSQGAHTYTEGRPIDLIEKDALVKLLKKVSVSG
ncbi:MAG: tetratricopeptide repeat protein [Treponema sp.]|nr:tetratricopeptide repeat protein [Treponema sp.]